MSDNNTARSTSSVGDPQTGTGGPPTFAAPALSPLADQIRRLIERHEIERVKIDDAGREWILPTDVLATLAKYSREAVGRALDALELAGYLEYNIAHGYSRKPADEKRGDDG